MKRVVKFALTLATSTILTSPALCQEQAPQSKSASASPSAGGIGDIVVFGQRKSVGQSAQKVPIAVSAFDPALLRAASTINVTDLGALAPNVQTPTAGTTPGFLNITIRGIGINSSLRSADPAVNVIQDGMVLAYPAGSIASTFDVESVEVLRGPQGVLFGRNTTGGAIALRTRRPQANFQMLADVSYGNYNTLNAAASVEGAVNADGAILAKLAVIYQRSDGFFENTNEGVWTAAPGNPTGAPINHATGHLPGQDELTFKPTFVFRLDDRNTLTLFTQYQRFNDGATAPRNFLPTGANPLPLGTTYGFTPTATGYRTNIAGGGYLRLREGHVIAELENKIGAATLTSTAAWRKIDMTSTVDFYGGPIPLFFLPDNPESSTQYSFETRLNVPLIEDRLDLTSGLFYLQYSADLTERRRFLTSIQTTPYTYRFAELKFHQNSRSYAGYLNLDWHVTDRATLSAGGRYTIDKKDFTGAPLVNCIGQSFANCAHTFYTVNKKWTNFSPRVVLNYQGDDVLLYASYTKGFRSGNFNNRVSDFVGFTAAAFTPANPETVDSYEIGMKSDMFDKRLRLNVSAFREDYKDIQQVLTLNLVGLPSIQTLLNAATARINGLEAEVIAQPIPALRLEGNFGYTDAKFKTFNVTVPGVSNPTDLKFARVPKYTASVAANLTIPVADNKVEGRVSYDWRSGFFTDLANNPLTYIDGYGLMNASLTYDAGKWTVGLFGTNLANVDYAIAKGFSFAYAKWGGAPRTFGLRVTAKLD